VPILKCSAQNGRKPKKSCARLQSLPSPVLLAQVLDMDVSAEAHVIRQVPTIVIGIVIKHDVVTVPQPVAAEGEIERRYAEKEAAETETPRASSGEPKHVVAADASRKVTVLKRMIQMIVRVVSAAVVAHPCSIVVNVRRARMAFLIRDVRGRSMGWSCSMRSRGRRTGCWRMRGTAANGVTAATSASMLRKCRNGKQQQ
jgi:hypothetical protein